MFNRATAAALSEFDDLLGLLRFELVGSEEEEEASALPAEVVVGTHSATLGLWNESGDVGRPDSCLFVLAKALKDEGRWKGAIWHEERNRDGHDLMRPIHHKLE